MGAATTKQWEEKAVEDKDRDIDMGFVFADQPLAANQNSSQKSHLFLEGQMENTSETTTRSVDYYAKSKHLEGPPFELPKQRRSPRSQIPQDWEGAIENYLIEFIYGSNYIGGAGTDYQSTAEICRKVWGREAVDIEIDEASPEYTRSKFDLEQRGYKFPTSEMIFRSRLEVIQHAKAFDYLYEGLLEGPLTEQMICDTHEILCKDQEHADGIPWREWAGLYRTEQVAAADPITAQKHIFICATAVKRYMAALVADFNQEGWGRQDTDTYTLAAKYCHRFVNIHPFAGGNGRMCRMLMNAILRVHTGMVVPIAYQGREAERREYLEIVRRGSRAFYQEDMDDIPQVSHVELGEFVKEIAELAWEDLYDDLEAADPQKLYGREKGVFVSSVMDWWG